MVDSSAPKSKLRIEVGTGVFGMGDEMLEVRLLIEDRDVLCDAWKSGGGRDPDDLIGPHSPLYPTDEPHDATLMRCGCGEEGCGSVVGRISADGDDVVWENFRDHRRRLKVPAIRFNRQQYVAELARAHTERDWESPLRATGRRVREILTDARDELRALGYTLHGHWPGVEPPHTGGRIYIGPLLEGLSVSLMENSDERPPRQRQVILGFPNVALDPEAKAREVVGVILERPVDTWPVTSLGEWYRTYES